LHDFCVIMVVLSIETSTSVCSAAIAVDGVTKISRMNREGTNHAKMLPIYIKELLDESASCGWHLDAVALSEGPGSYTGLRIGASTAKGICYGLNIPLIPIATTEVLCASLLANHPASQGNSTLVPMIDARRMEVYTDIQGVRAMIIDESAAATIKALSTEQKPVFYFGDGAEKCKPLLESENVHFVENIVPDAAVMGALAESKRDEATVRRTEQELAYYEPFYLKEFVAAPSHIKGLK